MDLQIIDRRGLVTCGAHSSYTLGRIYALGAKFPDSESSLFIYARLNNKALCGALKPSPSQTPADRVLTLRVGVPIYPKLVGLNILVIDIQALACGSNLPLLFPVSHRPPFVPSECQSDDHPWEK